MEYDIILCSSVCKYRGQYSTVDPLDEMIRSDRRIILFARFLDALAPPPENRCSDLYADSRPRSKMDSAESSAPGQMFVATLTAENRFVLEKSIITLLIISCCEEKKLPSDPFKPTISVFSFLMFEINFLDYFLPQDPRK